MSEYSDLQRAMNDRFSTEWNTLYATERTEMQVLNDERSQLQATNNWNMVTINAWNAKWNALMQAHGKRRSETQDRQNKERKELDAKYQPKSILKKAIGALIGLALGAFIVHYNVTYPELKEECFKFDTEPYPWGYCVLKHPESKSDLTILYNPGTLEKDSFLRAIESNKGTKDHEAFLKAFKPSEMPTIVSFNIYPSKVEAYDNVLDEEKYGALDLYTEPRLAFIRSVVVPQLFGVERIPHSVILMGTSRGGWNSLQIAHSMPNLWSRVLINSPLLGNCPFDPPKVNGLKLALAIMTQNWIGIAMAIEKFPCLDPNGEPKFNKMFAMGSETMLKEFYKDKTAYDIANPMNWEFPKGIPIMITEALQDDFPFVAPGRKYRDKLKAEGVDVTYIEVPGKHGTFPVAEMKQFLLR